MFKLVISFALLTVAAASAILPHVLLPHEEVRTIVKSEPIIKTVIEPRHVEFREPFVAKVGEYVEKVPSAVSYQSVSRIDKGLKTVTPILEAGYKTYTAPILKKVVEPFYVEEHIKSVHSPLTYATEHVPLTYAANLRTYLPPVTY